MSAAMKKPEDLFPPSEPPSAAQQRAADDLARLVAPKLERRSRPPRASRDQVARAREQMDAFAAAGDWSQASGTHLVALYEWAHKAVYEVDPLLDAKTWALAAAAANRMVAEHFEGDYGKAVVFLHWVWRREGETEKWRRENGRDGRVIGWRLQFAHGALITDYKVAAKRSLSACDPTKR